MDHAGIAAWRFKLKVQIHSFEDARDAYFNPQAAEWRDGFGIHDLVIGPNMYLRANFAGREQSGIPTSYAVVLYQTEIIRYYADGTFSVDNGGYATPTTMYRLNAVLPNGWAANHHRKQLALRWRDGEWLEFWPCTHERRFPVEAELDV